MTFSLPGAVGWLGPGAGHRAGSAGRRGRVLAVAAGVFCAAAVAPVALSVPAHAQGTCTVSGPTTTCTFVFTGAEQTFTVPNGVTQVDVTATGAGGGVEDNGVGGGRGAQVSGTLTGLSGGQTLYVEVGGAPTAGSPCAGSAQCTGGFNGGGSTRFGGGGRGASDIRTQPSTTPLTTTDSRLVVAAGGGAGWAGQCTGSPGGDAGQPGTNATCNGGDGGGAGTSTHGGAGGTGGGVFGGAPGTLGVGGRGGGPGASVTGGGGGGGYYGGGGGNINPFVTPSEGGGGGGGGSSQAAVQALVQASVLARRSR
ncbi:glycine-rich protein [Kitasatospora sp. NPDC004669]|uniref:glycine-rich protein n=1 Tax=Kitasatospora sp. NPDC004669 TaxID=3154555 RepID=UPI0033B5F8BD